MPESSELSYVIALSGPSGAGKSTVIQDLMSRFEGAVALRIDDYESTSAYPDTARWLAEGADPNQFHTPQFIADVLALRAGNSITHPNTQVTLQPHRYLIVEEPFGRERDQLQDIINFVAHIEIPLEIALARKLLRQNTFFPWEQDPEVFMTHLREFLAWYLSVGRAFYLAINERVLKNCDLVVDGTLPSAEVAEAIFRAVLTKRGQQS